MKTFLISLLSLFFCGSCLAQSGQIIKNDDVKKKEPTTLQQNEKGLNPETEKLLIEEENQGQRIQKLSPEIITRVYTIEETKAMQKRDEEKTKNNGPDPK